MDVIEKRDKRRATEGLIYSAATLVASAVKNATECGDLAAGAALMAAAKDLLQARKSMELMRERESS